MLRFDTLNTINKYTGNKNVRLQSHARLHLLKYEFGT